MPVARNFRSDLAILAFSIFKLVPLNFRVEFAIFAPIAHHFFRDLTNFELVACLSRLDLAIFVHDIYQDLPIFAPTGCFCR